ncbi:MAG: hypothetical protein RMM08_05915 [Armatimonadota bacterium]|nr:hypothetical protein [bacterium]MDW8320880.1 hypothetical protein [Armatimonadota bacterium]
MRWKQILETVLPLVLGVLAVQVKGVLHQMGGSSAAMLLLALVVVVFLIPQLRRYALVLICFGVCVFSLSRVWEGIRAVEWREAVWTDYAFVSMWMGIALFSGLAGIGEVWFNSPIWSQQSYLMAVALYFIGHSGSEWLRGKQASSVFLLLVGLVALGGVLRIGVGKKTPPEPVRRPSRRRVRWIHDAPSAEETRNNAT